jgi:hypothetical protein
MVRYYESDKAKRHRKMWADAGLTANDIENNLRVLGDLLRKKGESHFLKTGLEEIDYRENVMLRFT